MRERLRGGLFITGVGTGVGKTLVTTILCRQLQQAGRAVSALKPVASGFAAEDPESDSVLILRSLGIPPTGAAIAAISPWRFAAPLSPHQAARLEGRSVRLEEIADYCRRNASRPGDVRLIEGVGGVMSPVGSDATCLDLIAALGEPAVLVTGTYLGALSHTLTALAALAGRGVAVRGIVVSDSTDGVGLDETVEALRLFGGEGVPIHRLPRLAGDRESCWRSAPLLTGLCEDDDE